MQQGLWNKTGDVQTLDTNTVVPNYPNRTYSKI